MHVESSKENVHVLDLMRKSIPTYLPERPRCDSSHVFLGYILHPTRFGTD